MIYRFANCALDTDRRELRRGGTVVPIEPQVFDVLTLLVAHPQRLVTKDEIVNAVWGGRIVSESAISARIASARKAVGDSGAAQAVIRTVHGRGLMFVAEIEREERAQVELDGVPQSVESPRIRYCTNARGQALAYTLSGSGPPVMRSYLGTHLEADGLIPLDAGYRKILEPQHQVLRFDQAGCGMSDPSLEHLGLDEWGENLRVIADAAGWDRFPIFSMSGGAHQALRFAAKYPERVSRIVIIGGYVKGRTLRAPDGSPDFLRAMIGEGWEDPQTGFARTLSLAYYPEGPMDEVQACANAIRAAFTREASLKFRDIINSADNSEVMGQVQCPVLLVHGQFDTIHPLAEAQKLAAGIPDAELLVLESANHLPLPGHPSWDKFAQAFLRFLDMNR